MSAFSVSDKHINVLVAYAVENNRGNLIYFKGKSVDLSKHINRVELGQSLRNANGASMQSRYGCYEYDYEYKEEDISEYSDADINALCRCFNYQACEFNGWHESDAFHIIYAIERVILDKLMQDKTDLWAI